MPPQPTLPWSDALFFERQFKALAAYCYRFFPGRMDIAEEMAAEALYRLYTVDAAGIQIHNPHGWLRLVAKRLCLDELKRLGRFEEIDQLKEPDEPLSDEERRFYLGDEIDKRLNRLSRRQREAMDLHLAGFSHEEIALKMGITIQRVADLLAQARKRIRSE
jgi:RNA polymerase sigma factor (sigma-70 family)